MNDVQDRVARHVAFALQRIEQGDDVSAVVARLSKVSGVERRDFLKSVGKLAEAGNFPNALLKLRMAEIRSRPGNRGLPVEELEKRARKSIVESKRLKNLPAAAREAHRQKASRGAVEAAKNRPPEKEGARRKKLSRSTKRVWRSMKPGEKERFVGARNERIRATYASRGEEIAGQISDTWALKPLSEIDRIVQKRRKAREARTEEQKLQTRQKHQGHWSDEKRIRRALMQSPTFIKVPGLERVSGFALKPARDALARGALMNLLSGEAAESLERRLASSGVPESQAGVLVEKAARTVKKLKAKYPRLH